MDETDKSLINNAETDFSLINPDQEPDWETLMTEQGGLGRFQVISFIIMTFQTNSAGWIVYNLGFLLLQPKFVCHRIVDNDQIFIPMDSADYDRYCVKEHFCFNDDVVVKVDYENIYSLNNWIQKFDLTCGSRF